MFDIILMHPERANTKFHVILDIFLGCFCYCGIFQPNIYPNNNKNRWLKTDREHSNIISFNYRAVVHSQTQMQAAEKLGNEMIQESVSFTRTYDVYIGLN